MLAIREKELPVLASSVGDENLPPFTLTVPMLGQQEKNRILDQIATIERATVDLLDNSLSSEVQKQAHQEAHELSGSLKTLGLTFAVLLSRGIGLLLTRKMPFAEAVILQLAEFVITLREIIECELTKNDGMEQGHQLSSEKISLSSES